MSDASAGPLRAGSARLAALDVVKGISILLVATFHMTRSFTDAKIVPTSYGVVLSDTLAYGIHVHGFFVISGFLGARATGRRAFPAARIAHLYYAYLLWSVVSFAILSLSPSLHPLGLRDLLLVPVWPIQHYWFVLSLIVSLAVLHFARSDWALLVTAGAAILGDAVTLHSGWDVRFANTFYFYPFAALGAAFARHGGWPRFTTGGMVLGTALWVGGAVLVAPASMKQPALLPCSLGGLYALAWLSQSIAETGVARVFAYLGRQSLAIFLAHVIAGTGTRIILYRLMPGLNPFAGLFIAVVVAIAAPLVMVRVARALGLEAVLGLAPFARSRRSDIAAPIGQQGA